MEYTLQITFLCTNGQKTTLSIDGVKRDITDAEASALMDTIISKNIFKSKNGELIAKHSAKLTEKQVLSLSVA